MEITKKKYRRSVISSNPYKRRPESEMLEILTEVHGGRISKRSACEKYGINRNTMALFIKKFSLRTLGQNISNQVLSNMPEENKTALLEKQLKELTKQLEQAKLKNASLETMIKVAEEDLHIRIKKSMVPNSQKNEAKSSKGKPEKTLRTVWCYQAIVL